DINVKAGGLQTTAIGIASGAVVNGSNSHPSLVKPSSLPSFLTGTTGKYIVVLLVLIATGLLAYGITLTMVKDESALDTALQPYADSAYRGSGGGDDFDEGGRQKSLADSAFMQKAVAATAKVAQDRGILDKVEKKLEQADLPVRAAEALFFYIVGVFLMLILGFALAGFFGMLIATAAGALIPF